LTAVVMAHLTAFRPTASAAQEGPDAPPDAIARARKVVSDAMRAGAAPGAAVAVASDGTIVWSEAFGVSDVSSGAPVTPGTRFGVGSISKTFTLVAALTLADEARLDLDAPVETYLPDFPHRGRGVTMRRIGAHQSGIADDFANRHYYTTVHFSTLDSAYRGIAAAPLAFTPGSRTEYATGIFTLAGRVLEQVAHAPYPEVIRRRVFDPAGMTATVANDPRHPPPDRATFYVRSDGGGFERAPAFDPSFKLPGAGYLSTAEDLARFGAALLRPGLLSDRARRELFTPVPLADGTPTPYALGFQALREGDRRRLLQPGGGPGIASWLAVYPDDGVVVAILSNATGAPLGDDVLRAAADAFLRPPAPAPSPRPAPARPRRRGR
jgi:serine beta-lactamase-like protein LACTB, mitochondrial